MIIPLKLPLYPQSDASWKFYKKGFHKKYRLAIITKEQVYPRQLGISFIKMLLLDIW